MPQARVPSGAAGQGFRLKVEAIESSLMPLEIFVHQRANVDAAGTRVKEEFVFVASAYNLTLYPINEPDPAQSPAYYRKSVVDIVTASQEMADEFWDALKKEVCVLKEALDAMDVLVVAETFLCGEEESEELSEESE